MGSGISKPKVVVKPETHHHHSSSQKNSMNKSIIHNRKQTVVSQLIMEKINSAILLRRNTHPVIPMNRIILQFPLINNCFVNIRKAFDDFDVDESHTIQFEEFKASMKELGVHEVKEELLLQIFNESDVRLCKKLNFKEFLVALALIYLLDLIPETKTPRILLKTAPLEVRTVTPPGVRESMKMEMAAYNARVLESELETDEEAVTPARFRATSIRPDLPTTAGLMKEMGGPVRDGNLFDDETKLRNCFDLITDAYIQFDKMGTGSIKKSDLQAIVFGRLKRGNSRASRRGTFKDKEQKDKEQKDKEKKEKEKKDKERKDKEKKDGTDPINEFLTSERFHELDTRAGEFITFREFLFAFESWVGMEEDEAK